MAKSFEPDPRTFKITIIIALVFLSVMAVIIIRKKQAKEAANPPQKVLIQ